MSRQPTPRRRVKGLSEEKRLAKVRALLDRKEAKRRAQAEPGTRRLTP